METAFTDGEILDLQYMVKYCLDMEKEEHPHSSKVWVGRVGIILGKLKAMEVKRAA